MPKIVHVTAKQLCVLAKRYRIAAGKSRAQAARELHVARPAIVYAEEDPKQSLFKLRKRIIEKYSPHKVVGPAFWLERK
ncbi:MAG TPA: hypothetical protein VMV72_04865 [Verrucomicrobiae bacterium]|nr:hypothetical protein [Verrucomicrobiae bacterium]